MNKFYINSHKEFDIELDYNTKLVYNFESNNNIDFDTLSMGMSNDYAIALNEGSNMVRIGSLLFGKRNY